MRNSRCCNPLELMLWNIPPLAFNEFSPLQATETSSRTQDLRNPYLTAKVTKPLVYFQFYPDTKHAVLADSREHICLLRIAIKRKFAGLFQNGAIKLITETEFLLLAIGTLQLFLRDMEKKYLQKEYPCFELILQGWKNKAHR